MVAGRQGEKFEKEGEGAEEEEEVEMKENHAAKRNCE